MKNKTRAPALGRDREVLKEKSAESLDSRIQSYLLERNHGLNFKLDDKLFLSWLRRDRAIILSNDMTNGESRNIDTLRELRAIHSPDFGNARSIIISTGSKVANKKFSVAEMLGMQRPGLLVYMEAEKAKAVELLSHIMTLKWGSLDRIRKIYISRWLSSNGFYTKEELEAKMPSHKQSSFRFS
ncbi:MAG: hypothetical protein KGH66_02260 [Candidatus Micrarchaeota archaeon]|nr:hypothetical protein [Candidatus Micrarchaeota archaeon]